MKLSRLEYISILTTVLALVIMVSSFTAVNFSSRPIVVTAEGNGLSSSPASTGTSTSPDPSQAPFPININTAGEAALTLLPGIGEVRAAAIVAHREKHGSFLSPSQLLEVDGIGEATLAGMLDYITLN